LWVTNLKIFPYEHADNEHYDPTRKRKLLLHQKEILEIANKMKQMNRLLVPTVMYTKSNMVKIEVALARGKRMYEKREEIKKREWERKGID
jgi:SsrA-binding protein